MSAEHVIYNIVGEKVALGPLRRELLPVYQRWMNDFEAIRGLGIPPKPLTAEEEVAWFERSVKSPSDVTFTVYERETGRPVGNTGLHAIDTVNRSASFGIGLLEKSCWGKGYGTETTQLVCRYGFLHLGLHSIHLRVYAFHERAQRTYLRAGFKVAGREREAIFREGRFHDLVLMDLLATDVLGA